MWGAGQPDRESRAGAGPGGHVDATAMRVNDPFDEAQPEAYPFGRGRAGRFGAIEALENVADDFGRHADTGVADVDGAAAAGPPDMDRHAAAFGGELERVVEQVEQEP